MQRQRVSWIIAAACGTIVIVFIAQFHHCYFPFSQEEDFFSEGGQELKAQSELLQQKMKFLQFSEPAKAPLRQGISQDDPEMATYIRSLIDPPSVLPYNLTNPQQEHFSQLGQTQFLMEKILPNMTNGFFLEVGANDGERLSNTLFLERRMGWRGLLIEAFPQSYEDLLHKHRKAYSLQAALSLTTESTNVALHVAGVNGDLSSLFKNKVKKSKKIVVQAFPLYSILKAIDLPVIDYFSLDIEGAELEVLATIPWDKIKVRVMHVEFNHIKGKTKILVPAMAARGMHFIGTYSIDAWFVCPELYNQTMKNIS